MIPVSGFGYHEASSQIGPKIPEGVVQHGARNKGQTASQLSLVGGKPLLRGGRSLHRHHKLSRSWALMLVFLKRPLLSHVLK